MLSDEEAKAIQEIAKATGKSIDAIKDLGSFVAKYVDGPLTQGVGIIEDHLMYMRWERQQRLMERTEYYLKQKGLESPTRPIPLGHVIRFIQGGSLEDDNYLQDRWASLMANAADVEFEIEIRKAFASILDDLTSFDGLILSDIYSVKSDDPDKSEFDFEIWTAGLPDEIYTERPPESVGITPKQKVGVSLANLERLELINSYMASGGKTKHACVARTLFGREFVLACSVIDK